MTYKQFLMTAVQGINSGAVLGVNQQLPASWNPAGGEWWPLVCLHWSASSFASPVKITIYTLLFPTVVAESLITEDVCISAMNEVENDELFLGTKPENN